MRIAIVNDMPLAVAALSRVLRARSDLELAWVAADGEQAVENCRRDRPDLVLMDLVMPKMDGVEATRRIMAATPCPILIVTVDIGAHVSRVYDAMAHGALDAVDTPTLVGDPARAGATLLARIDRVARMREESASLGRLPSAPATQRGMVALGASAGGPGALAVVLKDLRAVAPPIVIVQHVDTCFARGMADWLGEQAGLAVRVACEGDRPAAGLALLAATNDHLSLSAEGTLHYVSEPASSVYRPSVDVFFGSVAQHWQAPCVAALLTGMGRDGAWGLLQLRQRGYVTIAQDRATAAVYGMPKAAVEAGAASQVLPLGQIGAACLAALAAA